jgi:outer membrane lipoprotein-sorting protein
MRFLYLLLSSFFILVFQTGKAQQNQFLEAGDSDPEALALLTAMSDKLDDWKILQLTFSFEYLMPDGQKMVEEGKIIQSDDRYRIEMGDQLVLSDGKYQWFYLKKRNEVQINDIDEAGTQMSPTYFFNFHQNDQFVYAITNQRISPSGAKILRVDFKPLDDFVEYAKIGLDIDEKSKLPVSLLVLLKEGGKYFFDDLTFSKWNGDTAGLFTFNAADYPGISIEDLRLD